MDTIISYSGGSLPCAIGIVRLSGDDAWDIFDKIFVTNNKKDPKKMLYGSALSRDGKVIDRCLATLFTEKSYTGEKMAEIYCHGSKAVVEELLRSGQQAGARLAEAGEYTKRAFLNGKLDLTSAEAVGDLIHAESLSQAKAAINQLDGGIYNKIIRIYNGVTGLLAHFYAVCDYTDEDIEDWQYEKAVELLTLAQTEINRLYSTFDKGSIIAGGLPCAIIGRPNAGKSSLLNRILGFERAIVTDEEGTTRDTIEGTVTLGGTVLRLVDTAGIREGTSKAEVLGIERSIEAAKQARLVICVLDGSSSVTSDDYRSMNVAKAAETSVLVVNKSDKGVRITDTFGFEKVFYVSAETGDGVDELIAYLESLVDYDENETLITNARQAGLLQKAAEAFYDAEISARMGQTADAFLLDAERGLGYLGEIIGKNPTVDVIDEIFSKFCVGK
ncbi:MAG: tRNA uridine-5-carboxymethylaminomethyl(34) synthesis GTPase MnmE [Ruminococcaceae bacterium]|nr:tRNA uridine-5-carboxymethylaminomethyl(34) synthesis GTPase MnmE [Oscillospiraceae bacterium]